MTLKSMTLKDWAVAVLLAFGCMVVNVLASFVWVWVYSQIEPGQTQAAYEAYAQEWAPVSSVVLGAPILFIAGWIAGRGREAGKAALMGLAVGATYVAIDVAIILSFMPTGGIWLWVVLSWISKPLASWLGGRVGAAKAA